MSWNAFELAPGGSAADLPCTSVSRIPNGMEMWWIAPNGSVQGAYWYDGGQWTRYELAPAGSAGGGGIAAVSRIPGTMELWWIGPNGSIQGAYWYDGKPWARYELAPAGSAALGSEIAVVSRIPGSMELWWIGANGSLQGAYWYDGKPWARYELAPAGSASSRSAIAAVSRVPNSMELWFIGANGSLQDRYWYDGTPWQGFELAPGGSAAGAGLTAVSRIPASMELWYVGAGGSIRDAYYYDDAPAPIIDWHHDPIVFGDGIPVGGRSSLTLRPDGSYTFMGHFHDSGFPDYNVSDAWVVRDNEGWVYTFGDQGSVEGTNHLFGPDRDHDWAVNGSNADLAARWSKMAGAQYRTTAKVDIAIDDMLEALVDEIEQIGGAITKIVAVVGPIVALV